MRMQLSYVVFILLLSVNVIGQETIIVEKIAEIGEVRFIKREAFGLGPSGIMVDEIENSLLIADYIYDKATVAYFKSGKLDHLEKIEFLASETTSFYMVGKYLISSSNIDFLIRKGNDQIIFIRPKHQKLKEYYGGISFIIKGNSQSYIAFFVNELGEPRAADTSGKVYSSTEAIAFLKTYDPVKFQQSQVRARELGLEGKFLLGKALVWGETYYQSSRQWNSFWSSDVFRATDRQIFYDLQGNAYQAVLRTKGEIGSEIWIVDPNAKYLIQVDVTKYSKILSTYKQGRLFTNSTYVSFGGNIYFYVAGEDFTEVFRIRRTWGDPDMYAMAINGYTKDEYGKYVDTVLPKMSKDDLRLLRNHVYALYGYVFQDQALNAYFDKIVWYLPNKDVNQASIVLPVERKALVERILEEEKKR